MNGSQRLREWIGGGERRRLAGHRVFVRTAVAPDLPPLLLIHGYPTASYDWVRVWPRLAARAACNEAGLPIDDHTDWDTMIG